MEVPVDCCHLVCDAMSSGRNAVTFQRILLPPSSALMEAAISSAISVHFYATCSVMTGTTVIFSIVWYNLRYVVDNRMNPMYIQILTPIHKRIRRKESIALKFALLICKEVMTLWNTLVRWSVCRQDAVGLHVPLTELFFSGLFCKKLLSVNKHYVSWVTQEAYSSSFTKRMFQLPSSLISPWA